jgi:hypothetical protein
MERRADWFGGFFQKAWGITGLSAVPRRYADGRRKAKKSGKRGLPPE